MHYNVHMFMNAAFIKGCCTGTGLIIAIGAQNAFVLRQGITRNHVFITVFICATIDAMLIACGVGGLGKIISSSQLLLNIARFGGAIFLFYYAFSSFRSAFKSNTLSVDNTPQDLPSRKKSILTILALSLLNPHVYLDTVILIGSIAAQFNDDRFYFGVGAAIASFIWFFTLGYAARFLQQLFTKPLAWKILDSLVGIIMFSIATSLLIWNPNHCN